MNIDAVIVLSFNLECRDKEGNVLKTIDCKLSESVLAKYVDELKREIEDGTDDHR